RRLARAAGCVLVVLLTLDLVAEVYFVSLNWVNPPATAFMLENGGGYQHDYVDLRYVSRYMAAATLAHEDGQLPTRFTGLDWGQWWSRAGSFVTGTKDPYGSPIPEQLSKNLLLWPYQDPFRKTADAVLAEQLVHAVSKQRVLELYLNEAQFGPHIYGVCDASWYYFDEAPDHMSYDDAYQLMGVLPGPDHAHRAPGGGIDMTSGTPDANWEAYYIAGARRWVPQELQTDGWQKLVAAMGITGQAHAEPSGPGDCRTMPQGIRTLIASGR
ncbi:MAG TPA: biosynthetic peptidoglycan transglycosylase, partial [Trebonia sp.]